MILVTGGTGLVGANLLLHLTKSVREESIIALYRTEKSKEKTFNLFKKNQKESNFKTILWVQGDVLDVPSLEIAFHNIDFVYHCAALISFNPNDEEKLRKTNIEGTANIVNFCISKKIKKLCYVSSIAAIGDLAQNETIISETSEWNPEVAHTDYAISKYGAEMEIWRGYQEGLEVVIVNPGVILGDSFWNQGSGTLFSKIKKGIPFYTNGSTGYVAVIDVVSIMFQLMNSTVNGERFILISENCTYKDIFDKISKRIKSKKPTIEAKPWLLNFACLIDAISHFIFRTERRITKITAQSLLNQDQYSADKVNQLLNHSFMKIEDCLDSITVDFLKNN